MPVSNGPNGFLHALTEADERQVVDLYISTDLPISEIAKRFNVSVSTVRRAALKAGVNASRCPRTSNETQQQIIKYYLDGNTLLDTSVEFGVAQWTVIDILKKAGIARRARGRYETSKRKRFARDC